MINLYSFVWNLMGIHNFISNDKTRIDVFIIITLVAHYWFATTEITHLKCYRKRCPFEYPSDDFTIWSSRNWQNAFNDTDSGWKLFEHLSGICWWLSSFSAAGDKVTNSGLVFLCIYLVPKAILQLEGASDSDSREFRVVWCWIPVQNRELGARKRSDLTAADYSLN